VGAKRRDAIVIPRPEEQTASAEVEIRAASSVRRLPSTVARTLQETTLRLGAVSDIPRVEAEILLMHVLGTSRSVLLTHPERPLTTGELDRYRALVGERVLGYPLPYLTGKVEFYGLDFEVSPEVLIPRSDTEVLVELALARRPTTVIDVGTGSGCIAIALATNLLAVTVYAIDISRPALAVAQRNAERHGVEDRIQFIVGDLLDRRPAPVDLIVSNPPYVSGDEWASLPSSIRHHEPRLALDGGPDGLAVIRRLLSQSQGLLEPGDALLIEIGCDQGDDAREIARTCFPEEGTTVRVHPDLGGRDRVLEVEV
jgi:release factor glutamine methyltransferase